MWMELTMCRQDGHALGTRLVNMDRVDWIEEAAGRYVVRMESETQVFLVRANYYELKRKLLGEPDYSAYPEKDPTPVTVEDEV